MQQVSFTQAPQLLANASWFRKLILSEKFTRQTIDGFNVHQFHWEHALSNINYVKCPSLRLGASEIQIRDGGVICRRVETLDELQFTFWFFRYLEIDNCFWTQIYGFGDILCVFAHVSADCRHGMVLTLTPRHSKQIHRYDADGSFGRRDIGVCLSNSFISKTNDCDQCPTVQLWICGHKQHHEMKTKQFSRENAMWKVDDLWCGKCRLYSARLFLSVLYICVGSQKAVNSLTHFNDRPYGILYVIATRDSIYFFR